MPLDIIVGAQWGDEGKGRVVDLLARSADYVARYNGGDNAGHTVSVGKKTFKLHIIPSGIIHPQTVGAIGSGLVVNPIVLLGEIDMLINSGVIINPERLILSHAAHLISPAHLALDVAQEARRGKSAIGTTLRGIGPAYSDKVARSGMRVEEMLNIESFSKAIRAHTEATNQTLIQLYGAEPLDASALANEFVSYARQLRPYIKDVSSRLDNSLRNGMNVLAEGAQGTLLDLDHGTYPYVTSSNPTASGALIGLGLGASYVERIIGVTKCFQTRVGAGPFPTEVFGSTADRLRGTGEHPWDEFGTTTGRPRRVGWLDTVLLRYAVRINGINELALTKLDILSGMEKINICASYQEENQLIEELPYGPGHLEGYQPIYEELPGWEEDLRDIRRWVDLPHGARAYILRIEELTKVPVRLISVGPEREQVVEIS
jgi:adenylosuccinate synthase